MLKIEIRPVDILPTVFQFLEYIAPSDNDLTKEQTVSNLNTWGLGLKNAFYLRFPDEIKIYGHDRKTAFSNKVSDVLMTILYPQTMNPYLGRVDGEASDFVQKRELAFLKILEHVFFKNARELGAEYTGSYGDDALLRHVSRESLEELKACLVDFQKVSRERIGSNSDIDAQISGMIQTLDDAFLSCALTREELLGSDRFVPPPNLKEPEV